MARHGRQATPRRRRQRRRGALGMVLRRALVVCAVAVTAFVALGAGALPGGGALRAMHVALGATASSPQAALAAELVRPVRAVANAAPLTGWVSTSDGMCYYDPATHQRAKGWLHLDGSTYYLSAGTGALQTGWVEVDGRRYWLGDDAHGRGALAYGCWLEQDGNRYYLGEDGAAVVGLATVDGVTRYFDETGAQQTGLVTCSDGATRYFDPQTGAMAAHEWVQLDGVFEPFDDDGSWVTLGEVLPAGDAQNVADMSARQRAVVAACDATPWPGANLCAGWVSRVFVNAGEEEIGGNACDIAATWCTSSDVDDLRPGMVIAVASHTRSEAGAQWGHVGICVGNGLVRDSARTGLRTVRLGSWLAWFGVSELPRWGWANGYDLRG